MLDFTPMRNGEKTLQELADPLTLDDFRNLTNGSIDMMLASIEGCVDDDVGFEPNDPDANDPAAEDPAEVNLAWNLGHVIAHTTSSGEEYAAQAQHLARGVPFPGRPVRAGRGRRSPAPLRRSGRCQSGHPVRRCEVTGLPIAGTQ